MKVTWQRRAGSGVCRWDVWCSLTVLRLDVTDSSLSLSHTPSPHGKCDRSQCVQGGVGAAGSVAALFVLSERDEQSVPFN